MGKILMNEKELNSSIKKLATKLDKELKNEKLIPVFVSVMKGSLYFFQDLTRNIKSKVFLDYLRITSYQGTKSTGKINMLLDITTDIKNRTVVLVDDVVDTGNSIQYLIKHLNKKHPKRIIVVSLFDKINSRKSDTKVDYCCKVLKEDSFLMGYGFDYNELDRNVPYVYIATKEDVQKMDKTLLKDKKNKSK